MRLIPSLLAALVFLPRSSATPPPQGWEERNRLRAELPTTESYVQSFRNRLAEERDSLASMEANPGTLGPDPDARERQFRAQRERIEVIQRKVAEWEQELAWTRRRLGILPGERPLGAHVPDLFRANPRKKP
jgi:hypothetical protein